MIQGWRNAWNQSAKPLFKNEGGHDFPLYIVQLANFMDRTDDAGKANGWAALRDA